MASCLDGLHGQLRKWDGPLKIAFPHRLGAGLAGGNWDDYRQKIYGFSRRIQEDQPGAVVIICRLDDRGPR